MIPVSSLLSPAAQRLAEPYASEPAQGIDPRVIEMLEEELEDDVEKLLESAQAIPVGEVIIRALVEFDESKHPRDDRGRFTGSTTLPPSSDDPAPGSKYYYHQAPRSTLEKIAEEGIVPRGGKGPGVTSLSPHLDSVHEWSGLIGRKDDDNVVMRVPRAGVRAIFTGDPIEEFDEDDNPNPDYDPNFPMRTTEYDPRDFSAELGARHVIPAHRLEAYIDGRWVKLKKDFRGNEFDESKHPRDKEGQFTDAGADSPQPDWANPVGGVASRAWGMSDEERREIVRLYTQSGGRYNQVNAHLREGREVDEETRKTIAVIDDLFERDARPVEKVLYRGISGFEPEELGLEEGVEFTDKGFVSTTADRSIANRFGAHSADGKLSGEGIGIIFKINAKGTPGVMLGGYSRYGEDETLLPRGTRFKVTSVKEGYPGEKFALVTMSVVKP